MSPVQTMPERIADLAVLRILTPATQTTLLDLLQRYHTVGFVVDDDVLFFLAQDKLVGANAHPDRVDAHLADLLIEFEAAKFLSQEYRRIGALGMKRRFCSQTLWIFIDLQRRLSAAVSRRGVCKGNFDTLGRCGSETRSAHGSKIPTET